MSPDLAAGGFDFLDDDGPAPVGQIPTAGRGSMPFAMVHGESLVAAAAWAAGEAGVELLDDNVAWVHVQAFEQPVVIHDPMCPLTPVSFLREAIAAATTGDEVVVGVRPVTDTVKTVRGEIGESGSVVGATVDREALWTVTSPVVLPAAVVAALDAWPDTDDFAALVTRLRERFPVRFLEAPATGARVGDQSAVTLLEAVAEVR